MRPRMSSSASRLSPGYFAANFLTALTEMIRIFVLSNHSGLSHDSLLKPSTTVSHHFDTGDQSEPNSMFET